MNKKLTMSVAIFAIAFVVYNVLVFAIGGFSGHEAAFWISYVFTVLAFGAVGVTGYLVSKNGLKNWLFNYPVVRYCILYFSLQLVSSVLFMALDYQVGGLWAFVVQLLLLAAFAILTIFAFLAKENISEVTNKVKKKTTYMALVRAEADALAMKCTDPVVKEDCRKLAEAIRYSDPVSADALSGLESSILENITACSNALDEGNFLLAKSLCEKALHLLAERNAKCRALK